MSNMEFLNKIELRGVVGVSRLVNCGATTACTFSLATEYAYKGQDGGIIIDTLWIQVCAYGPKPDWPNLNEILKGSKVFVQGRLRAKRYCDAQGIDRTCYEVVAQELKLLED